MTDFSRPDQAYLRKFGQAYTFTPADTGVPQPITGIPAAGAEAEETAPGQGSVFMSLFIGPGVTPSPVEGDEIATATHVYKVVGHPVDAIGGITLQLRKDREV